jgi:translation initiation factor IF-3
VVKEMKYRPKIGGGDFDTKTRKVEQFLGEGHKVKITIMFRGREMQHPELGRRSSTGWPKRSQTSARSRSTPKLRTVPAT